MSFGKISRQSIKNAVLDKSFISEKRFYSFFNIYVISMFEYNVFLCFINKMCAKKATLACKIKI